MARGAWHGDGWHHGPGWQGPGPLYGGPFLIPGFGWFVCDDPSSPYYDPYSPYYDQYCF
jgi:hypothetical protein